MALIQMDQALAHQALALSWPETILFPSFNRLIALNLTQLRDCGSLSNVSLRARISQIYINCANGFKLSSLKYLLS